MFSNLRDKKGFKYKVQHLIKQQAINQWHKYLFTCKIRND